MRRRGKGVIDILKSSAVKPALSELQGRLRACLNLPFHVTSYHVTSNMGSSSKLPAECKNLLR
jgi:hypothetical protein